MRGSELIAAERQRQIDVEGWTSEHDAMHGKFELLEAALSYFYWGDAQVRGILDDPDWKDAALLLSGRPAAWPWEPHYWKPADDPIRNLVKAGALIAAEIDRLQRAGA